MTNDITPFQIAVPEEQLSWKAGMLVRGLTAMPVTWP